MTVKPRIGIFVINYNGIRFLGKLFMEVLDRLSQLKEQYNENIDVWIVDNASTDSSAEIISMYKKLKLIQLRRNLGYGIACNIAYIITKKLRYDYDLLIFMNNDIILYRDKFINFLKTINRLETFFDKKYIATAILINGYDNNIDYGGAFIDDTGTTWGLRTIIKNPKSIDLYFKVLKFIHVHYVDGALLVVPAQAFKELGGFDNRLFMYLEDVDLSLRAHMLGFRTLLLPMVIGIHYRSSSSGKVSLFTLYYVIRNTTYVTLSYFGLNAFIKSLLLYITYAILLSLKLFLHRSLSITTPSNISKLSLHHCAVALGALIDGIKIWLKGGKKYHAPRTTYFSVPLRYLGTPKSHRRFIQRSILDLVIRSAHRLVREMH